MDKDVLNCLKVKADLLKTYILGAIEESKNENVEIVTTAYYVLLKYTSTNLKFRIKLSSEEDILRPLDEFKIMSSDAHDWSISNTFIYLGPLLDQGSVIHNILFKEMLIWKNAIYFSNNSIYMAGKTYTISLNLNTSTFVVKYVCVCGGTPLGEMEIYSLPFSEYTAELGLHTKLKQIKKKIDGLNAKTNKLLVEAMDDIKKKIHLECTIDKETIITKDSV